MNEKQLIFLVVADHDNKSLGASTLSVMTAAKQIGGDVQMLVCGKVCFFDYYYCE
jgi:electron transfer flavoprotein alpha subunit